MFKKCLDVAMRDMFSGEILVVGVQFEWMILEVFSNPGDSVILTKNILGGTEEDTKEIGFKVSDCEWRLGLFYFCCF